MVVKFRSKVTAWFLTICLAVTLIPDIGHAREASVEDDGGAKLSPEEVTEANVIEKTEDTTTYDLGAGEKMTVFHGGEVRYENEKGELTDYDPSLVKIKEAEKTMQGEPLTGYAYQNKEGDSKQYIPETLSEDTPILMEKDDYRITMSPLAETLEAFKTKSSNPDIEKEKMLTAYEGEEELSVNAVYEGTAGKGDIKYTSTEKGVKEIITLNEIPESNAFKYVMTLSEGLILRKNPVDEGITVYDERKDEIVAGIEAPWMNDAGGDSYSKQRKAYGI